MGERYSKIVLLTPNESSQGSIGDQKEATTVYEDEHASDDRDRRLKASSTVFPVFDRLSSELG